MEQSCQVPEMYSEVLEAIHNTFVDYPDVEADCYVFLSNLFLYAKLSTTMSAYAAQALTEMGRCSVCGAKLEVAHYKEPHTEFSPTIYENMTDVYCPNCDRSYLP